MSRSFEYYKIYKPYGMLSQFTREHPDHVTLADLDQRFGKDVYPVGRLDKDSEGLLILTNDKSVNHRLLAPEHKISKEYWCQVEGSPTQDQLARLRSGPEIRVNKKTHKCRPCQVQQMSESPGLPERDPPIRFRKNVPTSWLKICISEGKNRQVRRMCAKVGLPVLRLVRRAISNVTIHDMAVGEVQAIQIDDLD